MGNGGAAQLDQTQFAMGAFGAFLYGIGHFLGFAETQANAALAVTGYHQGRKAEATTTFDHFGATVDVYHFVNVFGRRLGFARTTVATTLATTATMTTASAATLTAATMTTTVTATARATI
jgi:hypothetical protein